MKAIVYTESGPSSVLSLAEREVPEPGPGDVRVRVAVSGVNPTDWKARASNPPTPGENVPNQDGAGVVDAVGDGVDAVSVGDRVWIYFAALQRPTGTAQEYVVLPASRVVPLPDDADFAVGASLGIPAVTAHRALTVHESGPGRLSPGALADRVVLVAGGAGAVGHAAIQLARWAEATVIATVSSPAKAALARAAGAHHVIDYRAEDVAARVREIAPAGVDHVVEVSLASNADLDAEVTGRSASIAYYADNGGDAFRMPLRPAFAKNLRVQGVLVYTMGDAAVRAAVEDVAAAVRDGALPVGEATGLPIIWFPLEETAAAHDAVEDGAVGKVLIRVADL